MGQALRPGAPDPQPPGHFCYECGRDFATYDALMTHKYMVHGYRNPLATRVTGNQCLCCFKLFHTTPRLFKHVAHSAHRCRDHYMDNVEEVDPAVQDRLFVKPPAKAAKLLHRPVRRMAAMDPYVAS